MVYDGRPSTGCLTCRKRRIKCDEAHPTCSQCIRSNRECLGYLHKHDLFFRDETSVTERRAKRSKDRPKQSPQAKNALCPITCSKSSTSASSSPTTSIAPPLSEPLADIAVNFFFASLVFSPRHPGVSRGLFDFLPELYLQCSETSALSYATKATALAAFGNHPGHQTSTRLSPLAWRSYGSALSSLNAALADPFLARRNETLMTVLLFCMAESLLITKSAAPAPQYPHTSHIDGAVSLLKLRGPSLQETPLSSRLFLAVRTHTFVERMQQGKPLDAYFYSPITGWQHAVAPALQNPANRLTQYTLLVPALRSRATSLLQQSKTPWAMYAVSMLLHEVRSIDIVLATWPASIPESWQFVETGRAVWRNETDPETGSNREREVERAGEPSTASQRQQPLLPDDYAHDIYPGPLHGYADIWLASVWNSYRVSRLFLNAIMLRCVAWLADANSSARNNNTEEQQQGSDGGGVHDESINARRTIQDMANDICASVPFFLGLERARLPRELSVLAPATVPATMVAMEGDNERKVAEEQEAALQKERNRQKEKEKDKDPNDCANHAHSHSGRCLPPSKSAAAAPVSTPPSPSPSPLTTNTTVHPATPTAIHGYFLLWPLFVCRSALPIPASQRSFLRSRMVDVASRFGIVQAGMLVDVGDKEAGRPLFSKKWEKGVFERMWEHANLYASSGI